MHGWEFWVVAVVVAFIVGLSKGGWSAIGNLSVPMLSLVIDPLMAAGLLLPVYLVSDAFGLWAYRRSYDRAVLMILVPAGILGILLGWVVIPWTSKHVPHGEDLITGLVGCIGIVFAIYMLVGPPKAEGSRRPAVGAGLFWGAIAGFTSYISHAGAPPYQVYVQPLKLDRMAYAGTTTILFAILNAVKLVPYSLNGQVSIDSLHTLAYLAAPAVIGVYVGKATVGMVSERTFYRVITWALLIVGVNLLGRSVMGRDPFVAVIEAIFA